MVASVKTNNQQKTSIYQCQFCPQDQTVVSVVGDTVCKAFRIFDNQLKQIPSVLGKHDAQN